MEELYTIIEVADNLQYGIVGTILSAVSGIVGYSSKRKAEKAANKAAKAAQQELVNATNALAARERRSISTRSPRYKTSIKLASSEYTKTSRIE